jgi:hypothetical protein
MQPSSTRIPASIATALVVACTAAVAQDGA